MIKNLATKPVNRLLEMLMRQRLLTGIIQLAKKSDAKALWFPQRQTAINSPLTTTLTDFTNNGNTVTLTNLAGTASDGYTNEPIISDMGSDVLFSTLINGDMETGTDIATNFNKEGAGTAVFSLDSSVKYTGTKSQKIVVSSGAVGFGFYKNNINFIPVEIGKQYYVSFYSFVGALAVMYLGTARYGSQYGSISCSVDTNFTQRSKMLTATTTQLYGYLTVGVGTSYFDALNIFCITDMFPDTNNRPTQTQMDRLVQQAISIWGYIDEVKIKILWQTGLTVDGADTYGSCVDNGSLDFVGTQNFAFTGVFVTPSVLQDCRLFCKNYDSGATIQYELNLGANGAFFITGVGGVSVGTLKPNTLYIFKAIRIDGVAKFYINDVLLINTTNTTSLITRAFIRMFARANNTTGTTHATFFKGALLQLTAHGSNVTEDSLLAFTNKAQQPYKATINAFTTVV